MSSCLSIKNHARNAAPCKANTSRSIACMKKGRSSNVFKTLMVAFWRQMRTLCAYEVRMSVTRTKLASHDEAETNNNSGTKRKSSRENDNNHNDSKASSSPSTANTWTTMKTFHIKTYGCQMNVM